MEFSTLATFFSGVSFVFFGLACQTSEYMRQEFIRYGYAPQRPLVGYLQLLGGIGLTVGYFFSPLIATAAAAGLGLMMTYGFGVRMYIRDTLLQATPAAGYAALNVYLAWHYGQHL